MNETNIDRYCYLAFQFVEQCFRNWLEERIYVDFMMQMVGDRKLNRGRI